MELTFKTVGMSYWDFDVESKQYRAFNDPVNDFHPDKVIWPEDYVNASHPDDMERVKKNIESMLQRIDKFPISFQNQMGSGVADSYYYRYPCWKE